MSFPIPVFEAHFSNLDCIRDLRPPLAGMKNLKNLWLSDTQLGDSGMVSVARLPSLRFLSLSGTNIGDEGLAHLQTAPQLEWLDLSETPVTDSGIECLRKFKGLRYLNLAGTQITSKGFLSLKDIPSLQGIRLTDVLAGRGAQYRVNLRHLSTTITAEEVKKLRDALPNCTIIR
jgi:Leucine-rich repeat (LRR) protein